MEKTRSSPALFSATEKGREQLTRKHAAQGDILHNLYPPGKGGGRKRSANPRLKHYVEKDMEDRRTAQAAEGKSQTSA